MIDKARQAGLAFDEDTEAAYPLNPDCRGTLHNSKTGLLYSLTPGIDRTIGAANFGGQGAANAGTIDRTQSLHESVTQRWDADTSYRPDALRKYFKMVGDPRVR
jgi:hypothetical protein